MYLDKQTYYEIKTTMDIGQQLKMLREYRKLTQAELSDKCGLKQATIASYENGRTKPTVEGIKAIIDALEFDIYITIHDKRDDYFALYI